MPSKPISLGSLHFEKKADAALCLKEMLKKYDVGDKVDANDTAILQAALARHPDVVAKTGSGIVSFSVRSADFGSKCFWVNRTNGSTEKFSWKACIYKS